MAENYTGMTGAIFDDPDIDNCEKYTVFSFLSIKSDMVGVLGVTSRKVAASCMVSKRKLWQILEGFERCDKIEISPGKKYIWVKSKMNFSLYKGRFSKKQLKKVQKLLKKWDFSQEFGANFAKRAVQLIENKYSFSIPYDDELNLTELNLTELNLTETKEQQQKSESEIRNQKPPEQIAEIQIKKVQEELQYNAGNWNVMVRGGNSREWIISLIQDFGVEKIFSTLKSIKQFYEDRGIHPSTDMANARAKFREWCEKQQGAGYQKKESEDERIERFLEEKGITD